MPNRNKQILDAAERLLRHYGWNKTTVSDIAREAGIAVGSVYLEFETKDAIVAALSQRCQESIIQSMRRAAEKKQSYAERLQNVISTRLQKFRAVSKEGQHAPDLFCCQSDAVKHVWEMSRVSEEGLIAQLLADGNRAGEFSIDDPYRIARTIIRIYDAFIPTPFKEIPPPTELESTHTLILYGLLYRK